MTSTFGDCASRKREVGVRIERQLGKQGGAHREVARRREYERVAVRCGARAFGHSDVARGAHLVFNDDRLAPFLRELLADDARQRVGHATGGERHDDAHRPRRIDLLREGEVRNAQRKDQGGHLSESASSLQTVPGNGE